ncbi:hypothetical protein PVL29_003685 [Vitis rotundifolia]|uniref:Uncharacterized protein n=1 Tax=Vitis rotundifolia TaxID=103349 RepID=A0AA39AES4_VITRO|nr:hypothetical protein PVL29_003685 [Vitis rotundifolia]
MIWKVESLKITPRTCAKNQPADIANCRLVVVGGGERNGIEGMVVGIVGIEGMVGKVVGSGGNVRFGIEGMVGMLGSGGSVALGKEGWVVGKDGNVGCGMVGRDGKGGIVGLGRVGSEGKVGRVGSEEGKGGNVGFGRVGKTGVIGTEGGAVSKRRRAARLTSMLENESRTKRDKMKQLQEAIAE